MFLLVSNFQVTAKTHLELANEYAAQSEKFFEERKRKICLN